MSKLEQAYRQMVAEENEAPEEEIMEAPRKADKSGGESSGLKNDAEDLGPANVDPEGTSPAAKADDKVKKDKGRKADKKVKADAMGAVKEDEEEDEDLDVVAEDEEIEEDEDVEEAHNGHDDEDDEEEDDEEEDEDDDEDLEAGYEDTLPTTKKAMIELLVKGMNKLTKEQIRTAHKNILTTVESAKASKKQESARAVKVKESIKVNVEDDVEALLNGEEDISEEFKKKTTTIFEAAVREKVETEVDRLEKEYEQSVAEEINEVRDDLVEKIDSYLDYVVEEWLKDNEVAIESGIRSEVTEEFISGLKRLFEEHYIDIPEDKVDVLSDLTKENEDLKEQVNNEINRNIELKKEKDTVSASEVFNDVVDGLADTEIEKMKSLGEGIEFEDEDSYREAISTLRENYFPKTRVAEEEVVEVEESPEDELNGPMATYYKAINRFNTQV